MEVNRANSEKRSIVQLRPSARTHDLRGESVGGYISWGGGSWFQVNAQNALFG